MCVCRARMRSRFLCFSASLTVLAGVHADSAAVPFSRRRAAFSSPDAASESDLSTPLHPFNSNIYNRERDHVFIGNQREQLQKSQPMPTSRDRAR